MIAKAWKSRFMVTFAGSILSILAPFSAFAASPQLTITAQGEPQVVLRHPDARQQIAVTHTEDSGNDRDVTRSVAYRAEPGGIVSISPQGQISPLANGKATITADFAGKLSAVLPVAVEAFESRRPLSFPNDVVPHLTRASCNSGACHGTPAGKNNFRLSLLGFEPETDHLFLTRESRGRRVQPALPAKSLLLLKASGEVPHGGGARIEKGSEAYRVIHDWIGEGLVYRPENDPIVQRIEVFPTDRVAPKGSTQQLVVTAVMSDGTKRDVTHVAEYKANQADMCEVDHHGWVQFHQRTGTTSVMVRFQEHVAAFMATIPLGTPNIVLPTEQNFIDKLVFQKLQTLGMPPSEICDDGTFLRRVSLDLTGRLPTLEETQQFLASTDPAKRQAKVDSLLETPGYADLFAGKWAAILRNKAGGNLEQVARETYAFHAWIRDGINRNVPFDQMVTQLVTARGTPGTNPAVSWYRTVSDPKDQMADIAQVFLGVRIQCAQCHHHPYEKWTQDDFYGFTAFFSTIGRKTVRKMPEDNVVFHKRSVAMAKNPNTNKDLPPTPLDGQPLAIPEENDPRPELAKWLTSPDNPFFAKMLANRYWKHFLGRGLVEPEDDMRVTNPPTHPELLAALADSVVQSGFDLKQLCRTICNSTTYQLHSFPNELNGDDEQNFARYYPRRLSAEVLLDAINDVAGAQNNFNRQPTGVRAVALPDDSANQESFFLRVFGRPQMDTACECERSASADLSQSLHLINSDSIENVLKTNNGRALLLARNKEMDDRAKINELYLRALSRPVQDAELVVALKHLENKRAKSAADPAALSADQAEREAFEDVLWVVLNTKEFLFNH